MSLCFSLQLCFSKVEYIVLHYQLLICVRMQTQESIWTSLSIKMKTTAFPEKTEQLPEPVVAFPCVYLSIWKSPHSLSTLRGPRKPHFFLSALLLCFLSLLTVLTQSKDPQNFHVDSNIECIYHKNRCVWSQMSWCSLFPWPLLSDNWQLKFWYVSSKF